MKTSFVVTEQYFENDFVKLPDSCRKQKDDTEESHKARVKKYLELCDNSTFTQIAYVIDPSDQFQIEFFNLYNEVQEQRITQSQTKTEKDKCILFWKKIL